MPDAETLDIEQPDQLTAYLRAAGHLEADEQPRIEVLYGGVSNRTVLVERAGGEAWVLKQALSKLRVKVDWFSDPARIEREALGIRRLAELAPESITPLIFEDPTNHLLAMRAVPQPHENWKTMLLAGQLDDEHVDQFARLLGTIHRQGDQRRESLSIEFADRSYFESLRLEPYYLFSAQQLPAAASFLTALVEDCRQHRDTLVHGDSSPKNVLIHSGRLILLDHEVIHFGDAAFDLGFSLAHFLSKAHHMIDHRDAFLVAASRYWHTYVQTLGAVSWHPGLEARAVRHTLGCLLARSVGRSQLEYLSELQRQHQATLVTQLMSSPPNLMDELVQNFAKGL